MLNTKYDLTPPPSGEGLKVRFLTFAAYHGH